MNIPKNFDKPFINDGRSCPKCGATFQKLTFKCPFCKMILINGDYLK